MKKPEVLAVTLGNGDSALFLNGEMVYSLAATDKGDMLNLADLAVEAPVALGIKMAAALGVNPHAVEMAVPSDEDWSWSDVYELVPAFNKDPDIVPVANWNSEAYVGEGGDPDNGKPFLIEVGDQREASGQVFIDVAPESGMAELAAAVTVEINRLDGIEGDMVCFHLHFDESNLAASFFKQGDKFIVRPETDVRLASTVLPNGEHAWILE